jgi:hypothetical protein
MASVNWEDCNASELDKADTAEFKTGPTAKAPWLPPRMDGEVKVMCSDCNGHLWSEGQENRDSDYAIPCPKKLAGKCAFGGRR